jgi:acyl-CoA dehydrogenase
MNRAWPGDALAFEESVTAALRDLGGIEFTRECERDPGLRSRLRATIEALELDQLAFAEGEVQAAACALAARAAGRVVAPWPLVAQLTATVVPDESVAAVYLVAGEPRRAEHLDLAGAAVAFDVRAGTGRRLTPRGAPTPMPLDPFGVACTVGPAEPLEVDPTVVSVVLSAYWVLGALETAADLASGYSVERSQFGRPISSFGAIQWRLADLAVDSSALSELAAFTLSRAIDGEATLADAWALRLQMLEAATRLLANAHQILGAIGLCEEHDLVVLDRHLQGALRRPLGTTQTATALADRVAAEGFEQLYPVSPLRTKERAAAR